MNITPGALTVDEDLHIVDQPARELVSRSSELLAALPRGAFHEGARACQIRHIVDGAGEPAELRDRLDRGRTELRGVSAELGLAVAAAGVLPVPVRMGDGADDTPLRRRLIADYESLARDQVHAGLRIRVAVGDRDTAVRVSRRLARFLPVLVAATASSPLRADGRDSGYASTRLLEEYNWPTAGIQVPVDTAADYDEMVSGLVSTGVVSDASMVRFGVQPAPDRVSVELRGCDACPATGTVTLVAVLFRALVTRELRLLSAGTPTAVAAEPALRAALWRAARSGLEGDLVDLDAMRPVLAADLITSLVEDLAPEFGAGTDAVGELVDETLHQGSSAFRQRRVLRRRGDVEDVVDLLVAETEGILDPSAVAAGGGAFDSYRPVEGVGGDETWDETFDTDGEPRAHYRTLIERMRALGTARLRARQFELERQTTAAGVSFRVTGQAHSQVMPVDLVPRVLEAEQWTRLARGIEQRERALDAFLRDVYGPQEFVRAGYLTPEALDRTPGYRPTNGRAGGTERVRANICGVDLVCTDDGRWVVLEDNLRMPAGAAFCHSLRGLSRSVSGDLMDGLDLHDPAEAYPMIGETLLAAAPPAAGDDVRLAVLSTGPGDSGWYEHTEIAERVGAALVIPERIAVVDGRLHHRDPRGGIHPVDVLYARIDEEMLLSSRGFDGQILRQPLLEAIDAGTLTVVNAFGNGVADDKATYVAVPDMIRFFLGEEPLTEQVPTYLCADREQRDVVLERLDQMVVKPIDGYGGAGITIGPECTAQELERRREELFVQPERYIAQEVVRLSTLPTFDGARAQRRHVDLRAFVHVRREGDRITATAVPAGLTRVAPEGSMIVNTSRGGGGKDTWIMR